MNKNNTTKFNSADLIRSLPQKQPFLFVDKVVDADARNLTVTCLKNVAINEYFFAGHFPGNPVLPGVIIVEIMAQASIILFSIVKPSMAHKQPVFYLGRVDVRFMKSVVPGDALLVHIKGNKITNSGGVVHAVATVDGSIVAAADITFGVK